MHRKCTVLAFVAFIWILFVVCAGCTSIKEGTRDPASQSPAVTETYSVVVTPVSTVPVRTEITAVITQLPQVEMTDSEIPPERDAEFNTMYMKSTGKIVNKTVLVIEAMAPGSVASAQLVYSPAMLYLRAEDLGFTIDNDYEQFLTLKTSTPENEAKRIAYLQFLFPAKNAAYHIADAAEAESFGDYQTALSMATVAKGDLQNIRPNPDLPPITPYNTLNIFLSEYIGRLNDEVVQQQNRETNKNPAYIDRFPRRGS